MRSGISALLLALLALVVLGASVAACAREAAPTSGMARIRAAGALRWGADTQGGEPHVYPDPENPGRVIGFEVDLANALARELGVRADFVQNDWSNLVPSLERGTFDMVMNGLEVTPSRAGRVLFTRPYYVFSERLMARKDDARITGLDSLGGLRVGTLANSLAFDLLRGGAGAGDAGERTPRAEAVMYEGVEEPYIDLVQRRTDAVLLDDIIARRYGEPKPELRVVGDVAEGFYAIAVRPSERDVKEALDQALDRISKSGELQDILKRAQLWNERQVRLATWSPKDQETMLAASSGPKRAHMSLAHAVLFAKGAAVTLALSTLAMALAIPLGMALALARLFGGGALRFFAAAYVEAYRGTPVLLQLYVLYYGLAPVLKMNAFVAAIVGLGMNYAAYEAEVYRAGIQAVPRGQLDAAYALGMSTPLALRRVVLPQAFRLALPNVTNDFIALLKDSSLVSVITVVELTKQMTITAIDVRGWLFPGLLCASLYFAMSYPLSRTARALEARLARQ